MVDSSSASLLEELNQKRKRMQTWPFVCVISVIAVIGLVVAGLNPLFTIAISIVLLLGVLVTHQLDLLSKTVVILYDFDTELVAAYERVVDCVDQLSRCGGIWHINARGHVYDPKYHGGAGHLVRRNRIKIGTGPPLFVKTNVPTPSVRLGAKSLFFFPERLILCDHDGVGALSYSDLSIVVNDKRFIEDQFVPPDAQVLDYTWQYVNKGGGPDRRFNNNRQIPICLYEELWLNSPSGLNEVIHLSRTGLGAQLDFAVQDLSDMVAKAASVPKPMAPPQVIAGPVVAQRIGEIQSTQHNGNAGARNAAPIPADVAFEALLDVLCCMMVADGRASSGEKKCIHELMEKVNAPWNNSEVYGRIAEFIERVQNDGFRRTLAKVLLRIQVFKQIGKQEILLKCLDAVSRSDGSLTEREIQLCNRVKAMMD